MLAGCTEMVMRAGEALRLAPQLPASVEELCGRVQAESAADAAGSWFTGFMDDWPPGDSWRANVDALLRDAHEANRHGRITAIGRQLVCDATLRIVRNRAWLATLLGLFPEIDRVALPPLVFIVGPPRSATTFVHHLLACHQDAITLPDYWVQNPVPDPALFRYDTYEWCRPESSNASIERWYARKIEEREKTLAGSRRLAPELHARHDPQAMMPAEEAHALFYLTGGYDPLLPHGIMPAAQCVSRILDMADNNPSAIGAQVRLLATLLRLHVWTQGPQLAAFGPGSSKFMLLKSTAHVLHLAALREQFPEARFIVTTRDCGECVQSLCGLVNACWELTTPNDDVPRWSGLESQTTVRIAKSLRLQPPVRLPPDALLPHIIASPFFHAPFELVTKSPLAYFLATCQSMHLGAPDEEARQHTLQFIADDRVRRERARALLASAAAAPIAVSDPLPWPERHSPLDQNCRVALLFAAVALAFAIALAMLATPAK